MSNATEAGTLISSDGVVALTVNNRFLLAAEALIPTPYPLRPHQLRHI